MNSSREALRPSHLIDVDVTIVSSYRRRQHLEELKTAALYFKNLGLSTYPDHLQEPLKIDDEFVFFGSNLEDFGNNKRRTEIEFLKAINRAKLVYVVVTNGYVGKSSGIELAFGLFMNTPVALSQTITDYGDSLPQEIKSIIETHKALLPIIPIDKIKELSIDALFYSLPNRERPSLTVVTEKDRKAMLLSIRSLTRSLNDS